MLPFLLSGLSLGLAAGLSPGPLLALVISQTLRHGLREGLRVAFAPLLSDVPIVLACLLVLWKVSGLGMALAWLSIPGSVFVGYLGYESLRTSGVIPAKESGAPRSLMKAVLVNLLNPSVYLFWVTVGAPMLRRGFERADGSAFAFLGGFYSCLVGSKICLAILVNRSRDVLAGRGYRLAMRLLGVLLLVVAVWMLAGGISSLLAPSGIKGQS